MARCSVVGTYVTKTIALRSVAILSDQDGLLRNIVEHGGLIRRIYRTYSDAFQSFRHQVVDYPALLGRRAIGRYPEFYVHVRQLSSGLFGSAPGNGPEIRGVIGNKCDVVFL